MRIFRERGADPEIKELKTAGKFTLYLVWRFYKNVNILEVLRQ
jgi:hypothetical protein